MLALPAGKYKAEWISPMTGEVLKNEMLISTGAPLELTSPDFEIDIALRILSVAL